MKYWLMFSTYVYYGDYISNIMLRYIEWIWSIRAQINLDALSCVFLFDVDVDHIRRINTQIVAH